MNCDKNCNCQIFHQDTLNEVTKIMYSENEFEEITKIFKVFNDITRVKILDAIKKHELCVCDLAYLIGVSKSAISHQMKYLKKYNLVKSKKIKKMVYYTLNDINTEKLINFGYIMSKGAK